MYEHLQTHKSYKVPAVVTVVKKRKTNQIKPVCSEGLNLRKLTDYASLSLTIEAFFH